MKTLACSFFLVGTLLALLPWKAEAKSELQQDLMEDRREIQQDLRELRHDIQSGSNSEIRQDLQALRLDVQDYRNDRAEARAVPIPGTLWLFGAGFAGLVAWKRRLDL